VTTVSVIIPCFNQAQYLPECLESLSAQTFRDFEIVIVDDGSEPPLLLDHLSRPAFCQGTIVWLPQNQGTAAALNAGIEVAHGEYIAVVHADDMVEPWHLESLMAHAGHKFCYGDLRFYVNGERAAAVVCPEWDFDKAKRKNLCHGAILFPREAWQIVGGYPEQMRDGREDWAMSLRLAHAGYPGYHVSGEPGYLYRQHGDNRSLHNHTPEAMARFKAQLWDVLPEVFG
jgi:glycosyltransferase involved in cell wall biosynthesis